MPKRTESLQIQVEIVGLDPQVWRRVLIPSNTTLARLHQIIQAAFGWAGYHMYEFRAGRLGYRQAGLSLQTMPLVGNRRIWLKTLAEKAPDVAYVYDFGDYWVHRVVVEGLLSETGMQSPVCIGGAGATPPEDCGGVFGYADFVAVMADESHPDHSEMVEWCGLKSWDPAAFDLVAVNARMRNLS